MPSQMFFQYSVYEIKGLIKPGIHAKDKTLGLEFLAPSLLLSSVRWLRRAAVLIGKVCHYCLAIVCVIYAF